MIEVIEPGFATTVQDEGRPGHYRQGMAPSGAMDLASYRLGNALVGNDPGAASLELTFTGPRLRFTQAATVAVTGGDMPTFVNGREAKAWMEIDVSAGDELSFGFLRSGVRAYIAVSGGIDVPAVLGSRSTHALVGIGGFEGRKLTAGDILPTGTVRNQASSLRKLLPEHIPAFSGKVELRYVPGLFSYRLSTRGIDQFNGRTWTVTPNADRTGIRMTSTEGPLEFVDGERPFGAGSDPSNVVDAGYPVGAIQIPSGTEPIVLSRDAVTAGGYFTVGAVISADLDRLGQCPTNGTVRFVPVSIEQAAAARQASAKYLSAAIAALSH
ncbi:biotin-dependent carboxyltransferase family protein [Arthrobacter sp. OAP107]|uniref:5-oxoprolinase subunit C family protein n=1 Tax=Arthrobacter sp. OAP107 TaxID=3156445 RepID=UPI0033941345